MADRFWLGLGLDIADENREAAADAGDPRWTAEAAAGRIRDGEILAPDAEGVPSFSQLQRRWLQCRRPGAELLREVPVRLFVFDILTCDGEASRSYVERRDALTARIGKSGTVQLPPSWADVDPAVVLGAAEELRLEGIVCKRLDTALGKDAAAEAQPIRDW